MTDTTYRLIVLGRDKVGETALTPDLARLVPGSILSGIRHKCRLGIERTDWIDDAGRPKPVRSVLVDAESAPGEWTIGLGYGDSPSLSSEQLEPPIKRRNVV